MRRIDVSSFQGKPQKYVALIDITTQAAESRWGPHDLSEDDLGPWYTFAFRLDSGMLAALVKEVENSPNQGYALTAIGEREPREMLEDFLADSGFGEDRVLHRPFD